MLQRDPVRNTASPNELSMRRISIRACLPLRDPSKVAINKLVGIVKRRLLSLVNETLTSASTDG